MKKINKTVLLVSLLSSFSAMAQGQPPVQSQVQPQVPIQQAPVTGTVTTAAELQAPVVIAPPQGNAFEKEISPLLREVSRKKSILEIKKIDREIDKLDEEAAKAQIERDNLAKGGSVGGGSPTNVYNPLVGVPSGLPSPMVSGSSPVMDMSTDVKVLMIFGFDDNLSAKISAGRQGGYVVRAGDVLPDGRVVVAVRSNFIEVKKGKNQSNSGIEKIFVSAGQPAKQGSSSDPAGGDRASTNIGANALPAVRTEPTANDRAVSQSMAPIAAPAPIPMNFSSIR